jgi:hypothetical protein
VKYGDGIIDTGWRYANGAAKTPFEQYCYYKERAGANTERKQDVGTNGTVLPAPPGVTDQAQRFSLCQWFNGGQP